MDEETEAGPYLTHLDRIEKELGTALADLDRLRSLEKRNEAAKSRYVMLKVALDNCVHFLRPGVPAGLIRERARATRVALYARKAGVATVLNGRTG
jgi:hypothetical protein